MSFLNFQTSAVRIEDFSTEDVFYVYPDSLQKAPLPESLEDAYGNGFLTISFYDSKFATWYMNIGNEEYIGSLQELERILYDWAVDEGYSW